MSKRELVVTIHSNGDYVATTHIDITSLNKEKNKVGCVQEKFLNSKAELQNLITKIEKKEVENTEFIVEMVLKIGDRHHADNFALGVYDRMNQDWIVFNGFSLYEGWTRHTGDPLHRMGSYVADFTRSFIDD